MNDLTHWRKLTRHPLSEIFGDMTEVEFEAVLADMKQHGYDQKQQVWLYEGKVLDGWHRICKAFLQGIEVIEAIQLTTMPPYRWRVLLNGEEVPILESVTGSHEAG